MHRKPNLLCILAIAAAMSVVVSTSADAAWTWTPEIGRWINPGRQPRETPALQFQYAEELLAAGDTEKAISEYRKVLRYFASSTYCDLAQYSIGRAYEAQRDYEEAVKEYQKVVEDYPDTKLFGHVLEKQRKIADHYFEEGVRREERFTLFRGSNFDRAITTYRQVINNQPYSDIAAGAQYRIGMCYMKLELYDEASTEFQKLIDYYPTSEWAAEAAFSTADCKLNQTRPFEYDKTAADDAIQKYRYFLKLYPESARTAEAREKLATLLDRAAEHDYNVALYYDRNLRYESARVYFASVVRDYPETQWAAKAREKLAEMP
jgi:outer membrane protein assembly factor BamD